MMLEFFVEDALAPAPTLDPVPPAKGPFHWLRKRNEYQRAKLARRGRRRFNGALKQIERSKSHTKVQFYTLVAENFSRLRQEVASEYARRVFGGVAK
jgi:hypothetical protein